MSTPASPVWKPSNARTVLVDAFVPVARGSTAVAPPPLNWPAKDPSDVLDYQLDITPAVAGDDSDVIATLDVTITPENPGDLVMHNAYSDGARAVIWLAEGQSGTVYTVTVLITTSSGRTLQRSLLLPVLSLSTPAVLATAILTNGGVMITDQNGNPVLTS